MRAVYAAEPNPLDPHSALRVGHRPDPLAQPGWTTVEVRAASLNHHDVWTLRGVGLPADSYPMILGCDAAGIDLSTGQEVIVYGVIPSPGWAGDETLDPGRTILSEFHQGAIAEYVSVPSGNVVPKPADMSYPEAASLGVAWLTAYRMLFTQSGLRPGETVLVQGASGGVASACISLARAAGLRVWATARTDEKRAFAIASGAHQAFPPGARLPERVDAVMETVGAATWSHSLKALRPGGRLVTAGATSGDLPAAELKRIFFLQLQVIGSTMGTKRELESLVQFVEASGLRPAIDRVLPLEDAPDAFKAMDVGDLLGKAVFVP